MSASPRGTSPSAQRFMAYLHGVVQAIEGTELFRDVRIQLDPFSIEDILKENTQLPACRVFVLKMDLDQQASSSRNTLLTLGITCLAGREGRADLKAASADMGALGLLFDLMSFVQADPYFGQTKVTAAKIDSSRIVLSEKSNEKAVAMTMLQTSCILLEHLPVWGEAADIFTGATATGVVLNGEPIEVGP